ncbi:MAG TPA: hypothetical protein DDY98_08740 [Ruminococcaceae bacterium]|nr:hypothetical protein [Oscillospiraceae bacterium]
MFPLSRFVHAFLHETETKNAKFVGTVSDEAFNPNARYDLSETAVLKKEKDKDFIILNITDPHFSDYDIRTLLAIPAARTIRRLVRQVKPDLITVTGDMVCGASTRLSVDRFTALMDSFHIPWAPMFGNHDAESNCDRNFLAEHLQQSQYCLLQKGDPAMGEGNYIVNITEDDRLVESLILIDTQTNHNIEKQKQWMAWAAQGAKELSDGQAQVSVFGHIPFAQYQAAYDEAWDEKSKKWRNEFGASGRAFERICCHRNQDGSPIEFGYFDVIKKAENIPFVFCGHEHMNNFSLVYDGVRLTYTLKVGKGSGYQSGFNGGTVITVGSSGIQRAEHRYIHGFFTKTESVF